MVAEKQVGAAYIGISTVLDPNYERAVNKLKGKLQNQTLTIKGLDGIQNALNKIGFNPSFLNQIKAADGLFASIVNKVNKIGGATFNVGRNAAGELVGTTVGATVGAGAATAGGIAVAGVVAASAAIATTNHELEKSVNSWATLEQKLNVINSIAGGGAEGLDKFKNSIMNVASSTSWTAEQVSDGMESLVRGGMTINEATGSIATVASLARSQVSNMGSMGDLLINTKNQFGLTVTAVEHVGDVLAATASVSAQNINDLGEAMKMAGSTAGKMGQSLERTAAQIAALANVGIKGSMGGTAVNALISRVTGNDKAIEAIKNLGVDTHDQNGHLRNLDEILKDVKTAMDARGKTEAEQQSLWAKIAGGEHIKSALTLAEADLGETVKLLEESNGFNARQAAAVDAGIEGNRAIIESIRDAYSKQRGEAGSEGYNERLENLKAALEAQKPIIEKQSAALERFANATSDWGTIKGELDTAWQEIKAAVLEAGVMIADFLKPVAGWLAKILQEITGATERVNTIVEGQKDETIDTYKQNRADVFDTARRRQAFESKEVQNLNYKGLNGEAAYNQAVLDKNALELTENRTPDQQAKLDAANDFIKQVESTFKGNKDVLSNLNAAELKQLQDVNKKALDSLKTALIQADANVAKIEAREGSSAKDKAYNDPKHAGDKKAYELQRELQNLIKSYETKQAKLDAATNLKTLQEQKENKGENKNDIPLPVDLDRENLDHENTGQDTNAAQSAAAVEEYQKQSSAIDEARRQKDLEKESKDWSADQIKERLENVGGEKEDLQAKLDAARSQFESMQEQGLDTTDLEKVIDALIKAIAKATATESILNKELPNAEARDAAKKIEEKNKEQKEDQLEAEAKAIGVNKEDLQKFIDGQFQLHGNGILQNASQGGLDASAVNSLTVNFGYEADQLETLRKLLRHVENIDGKSAVELVPAVMN